jgi:hypothetical protein|tara:strand:+ start:215 stop:559 length:345 start_codon:yes stop_codon:yes gene_type:complete
MAAVYVSNLIINQGATFNQEFSLVESDDSGPLNLSGYSIAAQFRKHAGSSSKTDFTTAVVNASEGKLQVSLTSTQTAAITKPGRYLYDIVITTAAGEATRVVEGSVLVREGVTR